MTARNRYSRRVDNLVASPIREILAVIERPGMISFAGGLPAAETFPQLDVGAIPRQWLQYGPSEGGGRRQSSANHLHIAHQGERSSVSLSLSSGLIRSGLEAFFIARKNLSRSVASRQRRYERRRRTPTPKNAARR